MWLRAMGTQISTSLGAQEKTHSVSCLSLSVFYSFIQVTDYATTRSVFSPCMTAKRTVGVWAASFYEPAFRLNWDK